jgi:hypothetical protein
MRAQPFTKAAKRSNYPRSAAATYNGAARGSSGSSETSAPEAALSAGPATRPSSPQVTQAQARARHRVSLTRWPQEVPAFRRVRAAVRQSSSRPGYTHATHPPHGVLRACEPGLASRPATLGIPRPDTTRRALAPSCGPRVSHEPRDLAYASRACTRETPRLPSRRLRWR